MRIVCPQCGYSREIPTDRIPAASNMATCPKCRLRFRFRGAPLPSVEPAPDHEPVYPPRPSRPAPSEVPAPAQEYTVPRTKVPWTYAPEHTPERVVERAVERPQASPHSTPQRFPDPDPSEAAPPAQAAAPSPYGENPWERLAGQPPVEPVKPSAPLDLDTALAEGVRDAFDEAHPARGESARSIQADEPVSHESTPHEPVPGEPVPADPAFWPDEGAAVPEEASGAMSGSDSVRDIWSRLQAMGGDAGPADGKERGAKRPQGAECRVCWENFEQKGAIPAFAVTVKDILFAPGDFFDGLPPMVGKARPLIFTIVVSILVMLFALIWEYFGLQLGGLRDLSHTEGFQGLGAGPAGGLALLGFAPVFTACFVFLDAGLSYLFLGLLRAATKSFAETFRVVCYAGCPWILAVLPVPYPYLIPVMLLWTMTLQAISLRKLHQTGYPQVLASVLVKWSLYCMACFAVLRVLVMRG